MKCPIPSTSRPTRTRPFNLRLCTSGFALLVVAGLLLGSTWKPADNSDKLVVGHHAASFKVPSGYRVEPFLTNLDMPTTAIFDGEDMLVAEAGSPDGASPRILRIKPDGSVVVVASRGLWAPVTGLLLKEGQLYVSHRGRVSVVQADGRLRDIVSDLPSYGDHVNNEIVLGPDGAIYLGQGTVTNAAVVGLDNYEQGWLIRRPYLHEVPCQDVQSVGQNYRTSDPLGGNSQTVVLTGAYQPFGTLAILGEIAVGSAKCGGAVLRFNPDGSGLEVVAWGLRDPQGLAFDRQGQLWVTNHGTEPRGSRKILGDLDSMVQVRAGAWYGWPDFVDGQPVTADRFKAPGNSGPGMLWEEHPPLSRAFLTFGPSDDANGLTFSPGGSFGFEGDAFIAVSDGPFQTAAAADADSASPRILRVDVKTATVHDFASNALPGAAAAHPPSGFELPSDVVFGPDTSLYIVDRGASIAADRDAEPASLTGTIWRIYPEGGRALRPEGPTAAPPRALPAQAPGLADARTGILIIVGIILLTFAFAMIGLVMLRRFVKLDI